MYIMVPDGEKSCGEQYNCGGESHEHLDVLETNLKNKEHY